MTAAISQKADGRRWKWFAGLLITVVFVAAIFWVLSGICFGVMDILMRLHRTKAQFHCSFHQYLHNPWYVFTLYENWWQLFIRSLRLLKTSAFLYLPFVAILGTLLVAASIILRQEGAIRLWYVLNHHFAKLKDVRKMGINRYTGVVLGRFGDMLLGADKESSTMCIGEMGTGKTSSVSVPTVLRADEASVVAVDLTGLLPKHTAGYRAKLGEVYYFNWDCLDEPQNNIYYPRWNPLAEANIPQSPLETDAYFKRMADYLIEPEEAEEDNYWNLLIHNFAVTIFGYWHAKIMQAQANDYFLEKLLADTPLTRDDRDVLLSYYIQMPKHAAQRGIDELQDDNLAAATYVPIGSWGGTPEKWLGREMCFALITDWLLHNLANSSDNNGIDWYRWVKSLLDETMLFAYGPAIAEGFRSIMQLSPKQRTMVFEKLLKAFEPFTVPSIRERTNGNDIDLKDIRGIYNPETGKTHPISVYSLANTRFSKIINQIFVDEILEQALKDEGSKGELPILLVLDDLGHNMRLKNLTRAIEAPTAQKISALLLCNSLSLVANTYSREELEVMIMHTDYKIIKAIDGRHLSQQMDKLASFSTRSVEIPLMKKKLQLRKTKPYADASYFHRLAKDFKLCKEIKTDTRKCQIVLARGFYNRPIIADSVFFASDEKFGKSANIPANYALPIQKVLQKSEDELTTPQADYLTYPKQNNIKTEPVEGDVSNNGNTSE
ncbi:MAG: type IV secretory system conjugative DNA transfer family protein [Alphaproteobacteria bacterium]|nr:type IV secretory system conjugative DNA transfer family protein [Alphaproteobacteria bacterium]MBQ9234851.1 type IV secretory system conjugative DNA transfer family protein [Alphaproteobacteria bacterium]